MKKREHQSPLEIRDVTKSRYTGFVPPCAVYCGACPRFLRKKDPCAGAESHCRKRRCQGIYVCCVERKKLTHCHECPTFPCARFKRFAATWIRCGQDLVANQRLLAELGSARWLAAMATSDRDAPESPGPAR